jgi:type II secretory pathway pseudopilin PulG
MTLIEVVVSVALVAVVIALASRSLRFAVQSKKLNEKLDVLQRLRLAELRLRKEVSTGVAILFPAVDVTASASPEPGLVWVGDVNEVRLLYLDGAGRLKVKTKGEDPLVLASGIVDLQVKQPIKGQMECTVKAESTDGRSVSVVFSGHVGNNFLGEGSAP